MVGEEQLCMRGSTVGSRAGRASLSGHTVPELGLRVIWLPGTKDIFIRARGRIWASGAAGLASRYEESVGTFGIWQVQLPFSCCTFCLASTLQHRAPAGDVCQGGGPCVTQGTGAPLLWRQGWESWGYSAWGKEGSRET